MKGIWKTRGWALMMLVVLAAGLLNGCSAADSNKAADGAGIANMADSAPKDESMSQSGSDSAPASTEASTTSADDKAASPSAGMSTANIPALSQKLIYRANLTMEVKDYAKAQSALQNLITLSGGYMIEFTDSKSLNELGGNFTIKVPAGGFMNFIGELEKMKPVELQRSVQGTDVTEEYVDLQARLKAKQVVEARLLSFMENAQKASDLVAFSKELGAVQEEIERIKGRTRYLDENVAFSTIQLRVYQPLEPAAAKQDTAKDPLFDRAGNAMKESGRFLVSIAEAAVILLAGLLPLLIIILPALALVYWFVIRKQKKTVQLTDQASETTSKE
ncbi:DUF4349 domain-containing protein [Paenibacillus gansuensis]|uniref:DUF4349 domain-containing protein n=1 Tax=Paenibacillus gansuensis TaxID=306542 RepID=A0ABW5PCR3_9BACL